MQWLRVPGDDAAAFLCERYHQGCPPELILNSELPGGFATLAAELSAANGHPVTITIPASGPARDLLEIARMNHAYRKEVDDG
jgi:excinuclease UvrABC nuclease subunit